MPTEIDMGLHVLDMLETADDGRQLLAIDQDLDLALRRAAQFGGGKVTLDIKAAFEVLNIDELAVKVTHKIAMPVRKPAARDHMTLDTTFELGPAGAPTLTVESVTVHAKRSHQTVMPYLKSPTLVRDDGGSN